MRVVLVLDGAEDVESVENNPRLDALLRSDAVRVVAVVEPATLTRAFSGWLGDLRRNRSVLVLQPGAEADVEAVAGVKASLRPGQDFPPGRGVLRGARPTTARAGRLPAVQSGRDRPLRLCARA